MPSKSHGERIFGAACVRVALERSGQDPASSGIYQGTLEDLGVDDESVLAYLSDHRREVEARLDAHGAKHGR